MSVVQVIQQVLRPADKQSRHIDVPSVAGDGHVDDVSVSRREDLVLLRAQLSDVTNDSVQLSPRQQLSGEFWAQQLRLDPAAVPPNVHYLWCSGGRERWFEFKHYLSVLSVMRALQPHKIVFHYDSEPPVDKNQYNLWLRDLKNDAQFFIMQPMTGELADYCAGDRSARIQLILRTLDAEGGYYVSENTWLLQVPAARAQQDLEASLDLDSLDGYVMLRKNTYKQQYTALADYVKDTSLKASKSTCSPAHQLYHADVKMVCTNVKGDKFERFYPMNIWDLDDPFGRLARNIFYGSEKILKPKPSYDKLVPNIGHMIWIGGGPMDFVFYLSLLSMLFVARVDVVFIHGDAPPHGVYWDKLQALPRISARIKCIATAPPLSVYQGPIQPYYRALMSDVIRVDLMIKYGGVYTDTDAIWTKPLTLEERGYDAVACYDWVDWSYPYPDSVNFGVSYGKRNAPFWRLFRDSMRVLNNDLHGFTGVMYPYKILEKFPHLLRIDKRLSVICYYSRCHPIWVDDYHNMKKDHVVDNSIPNWRQDVHAFHWTYPNPSEYANETALLQATGVFAEIGQNVLRLAGLIS